MIFGKTAPWPDDDFADAAAAARDDDDELLPLRGVGRKAPADGLMSGEVGAHTI